MSQQELLKEVVAALVSSGIPYMLTGSLVSSLQGEPRSTHDIDVVVAMQRSDSSRLLAFFPRPRYYFDEQDVAESIEARTMFNLIDSIEGDKVDFWLLTDDPFDRTRFARRMSQDILGTTMVVSRPEDTILQKLRWAALAGGSEKQVGDALRVYELQFPGLDGPYLREWAVRLGVGDLLDRIEHEAVTG
jgi:hypothetical protein